MQAYAHRIDSPARSATRQPDPYPHLREALAPRYADQSPEAIEALVEHTWGPDVSAADLESLLEFDLGGALSSIGRTVANVASQAAPVLARAAPGALQGAMSGAALGPWGALGGALLGGVGSALQGPAPSGAARPPGPSMPSLPLPGAGGIGLPLGGGSPAAGQLLGLLGRPEVLQALTAMMMGPAGRSSIPVGPGNTSVPIGAFGNLLGMLGTRASAEYNRFAATTEATPEYLLDYAGEFKADPANAAHRAEVLLEMLNEANRTEARPRRLRESMPGYTYDWARERMDAESEAYDAMDLVEFYATYDSSDAFDSMDAYDAVEAYESTDVFESWSEFNE